MIHGRLRPENEHFSHETTNIFNEILKHQLCGSTYHGFIRSLASTNLLLKK